MISCLIYLITTTTFFWSQEPLHKNIWCLEEVTTRRIDVPGFNEIAGDFDRRIFLFLRVYLKFPQTVCFTRIRILFPRPCKGVKWIWLSEIPRKKDRFWWFLVIRADEMIYSTNLYNQYLPLLYYVDSCSDVTLFLQDYRGHVQWTATGQMQSHLWKSLVLMESRGPGSGCVWGEPSEEDSCAGSRGTARCGIFFSVLFWGKG